MGSEGGNGGHSCGHRLVPFNQVVYRIASTGLNLPPSQVLTMHSGFVSAFASAVPSGLPLYSILRVPASDSQPAELFASQVNKSAHFNFPLDSKTSAVQLDRGFA